MVTHAEGIPNDDCQRVTVSKRNYIELIVNISENGLGCEGNLPNIGDEDGHYEESRPL